MRNQVRPSQKVNIGIVRLKGTMDFRSLEALLIDKVPAR